jgi:UDP-N-acetylmuramate--alanine ligase
MLGRRNCSDMRIHFIGIGGIGMSGIAEVMHALGYVIQGSDKVSSQNVERLEKLGISAFVGHNEKNVKNADVVVFSSAIMQDNPELVAAKKLEIPCLSRAEMLSQIVRFKKSVVVAGSHGKTTVTSMCAAVLEMASFDPTVVNGGIINAYNTNAKLGSGDWAVIESDESDGSFTRFFPTIEIITNVDREHILHYGSFDALKEAFKTFLNNLPFYGVGIACIDDDNVTAIVKDITDRKIITYGIESDANYKAINIRKTKDGTVFDVLHGDCKIKNIETPLFGDHNVRNSLSVIAMANELAIDLDTVKATLASFTGVKRRFTEVGKINGATVIDDYAHHPTEIKTVIAAARQKTDGKVLIICQPHRFTRLSMLFDDFCSCFDGADAVIIIPVYKADDNESAQITSDDLFQAMKRRGRNVSFAGSEAALSELLASMIEKMYIDAEDIVIFAGAGDISKMAYRIVKDLKRAK